MAENRRLTWIEKKFGRAREYKSLAAVGASFLALLGFMKVTDAVFDARARQLGIEHILNPQKIEQRASPIDLPSQNFYRVPTHAEVDPAGYSNLVRSAEDPNFPIANNFDYLPGMDDNPKAKKLENKLKSAPEKINPAPKKPEYRAPTNQLEEKAYADIAIRNNNPGNLRVIPGKKWKGQTGQDSRGFCVFDSLEHGLRAMGRNLQDYHKMYGRDTINEIVGSWAPKVENDTEGYIAKVSAETGYHPNQELDMTDKKVVTNLIVSIVKREHSKNVPRYLVEKSIKDIYRN